MIRTSLTLEIVITNPYAKNKNKTIHGSLYMTVHQFLYKYRLSYSYMGLYECFFAFFFLQIYQIYFRSSQSLVPNHIHV